MGYFGDSRAQGLRLNDVQDFDALGKQERKTGSDNVEDIKNAQKTSIGPCALPWIAPIFTGLEWEVKTFTFKF